MPGENIKKKSIAEIARKVGFVFQNPNQMLFTNSVERELALSLKRFRMSKDEKEQKISWMLDFFALENLRKSHPRLLSRGEKQKLVLATVLIQEPKAVILDEPFSGIDMTQRVALREYIETLKEQGKLIILITHDIAALLESCERIVALSKNGTAVFDGPALELLSASKRFREIGLEETPLLKMLNSLRSFGLPKGVLKKEDLISFLKDL